MKYLLTIYDDESMWSDAQPGDVNQMMDGYRKFGEEVHGNGAFVAGEALESVSTATTVRVQGRRARHHRRPVRGDEGAARRLLPARVQGPRRGDRVRGEDPGAQSGWIEVRPVRVFGRRQGPAQRSTACSGGVGTGGRRRSSASSATSTSPRRRSRTRSWRSSAGRATASPQRPARGSRRPRATRRSTACGVRRVLRGEARAARGAGRRSRRSRTSADELDDDRLRLIFTCCHPALAPGGAGRAHPADARRAVERRRSRARSSWPSRRWRSASCAPSARSRVAGIPTACPRTRELPRPAAVGARGRLPDLQRGLRGDRGRSAGAARAVRGGDPARPAARRAACPTARAARPARADALPRTRAATRASTPTGGSC